MEQTDFSWALRNIKNGSRGARAGWNGCDFEAGARWARRELEIELVEIREHLDTINRWFWNPRHEAQEAIKTIDRILDGK